MANDPFPILVPDVIRESVAVGLLPISVPVWVRDFMLHTAWAKAGGRGVAEAGGPANLAATAQPKPRMTSP